MSNPIDDIACVEPSGPNDQRSIALRSRLDESNRGVVGPFPAIPRALRLKRDEQGQVIPFTEEEQEHNALALRAAVVRLRAINSKLPPKRTKRIWPAMFSWMPMSSISSALRPNPTKQTPSSNGLTKLPLGARNSS